LIGKGIHHINEKETHHAPQLIDEYAGADPEEGVPLQGNDFFCIQQLIIIGNAQKYHHKTRQQVAEGIQLLHFLYEQKICQGEQDVNGGKYADGLSKCRQRQDAEKEPEIEQIAKKMKYGVEPLVAPRKMGVEIKLPWPGDPETFRQESEEQEEGKCF
jgi:hypothetical protein